jgi:hypothetical protein
MSVFVFSPLSVCVSLSHIVSPAHIYESVHFPLLFSLQTYHAPLPSPPQSRHILPVNIYILSLSRYKSTPEYFLKSCEPFCPFLCIKTSKTPSILYCR